MALGADEIRIVAEHCRREANGRSIVNDMAEEIRRAGPAIRAEVRAHMLATLPKRGGLNLWAARAPVRINVRRGLNSAGVTVTVGRNSQTGRADFKGLDAGMVRHPFYGNRKRWYANGVTPGSISEGITEEGRQVLEQAVLDAAERAAIRILYGG